MIFVARRMLRGAGLAGAARYALTAFGTALVTGFLLSAVVVLAIPADPSACQGNGVDAPGCTRPRYGADLLNQSGLHPGVAIVCALLAVPVLVFLGQCARIAGAQRDRRLAALRLAGATPAQVSQLTAIETGLACALGSVLGLVGFLVLRAVISAAHGDQIPRALPSDVALPPIPAALVVLLVPALGVLVSTRALRNVVVNPLGVARRQHLKPPAGWPVVLLVAGVAMLALPIMLVNAGTITSSGPSAVIVFIGIVLIVIGLLSSAAWICVTSARLAARRARRPAMLLAARRLEDDPHGQTRAMSAVLLCVLFATGAAVMRAQVLDPRSHYSNPHFYATAYDLVDLAIIVGVVVAAMGLLVANVEAMMQRRRSLAALVALGCPVATLRRAVLVQTMLPMIPMTLLAAAAGSAGATVFAGSLVSGTPLPYTRLALITVLAIVISAAAAALTLAALRQSVVPAELRYE